MKQIDFNQIKLGDTGIFLIVHCSFGSVFKRYQITTVGQVLNDNLMNEVMQHCREETRIELRGFISLLKFKYLGIPLVNNINLDDMSKNYDLPFLLASFGFSKEDFRMVRSWYFGVNRRRCIFTNESHNETIKNSTIIEFFKIIYNFIIEIENKYGGSDIDRKRLKRKLELIIESYEKSKELTQTTIPQETQIEDKNPSQQEHDILVILKDQLVKLIGVRDNLDAQIQDLQQKIDALTNFKTESGVSR